MAARVTAQAHDPRLSAGDWVMTPAGPGRLLAVLGRQASVEMDFAYPVKFPLKALGPIGQRAEAEAPCAVCGEPTRFRCLHCEHPTCEHHAGHSRKLG